MRHTFASLMISNGEDILWISNMLGHTQEAVNREHYTRKLKPDLAKFWHTFEIGGLKVSILGVIRGGQGGIRTLGTLTSTHP